MKILSLAKVCVLASISICSINSSFAIGVAGIKLCNPNNSGYLTSNGFFNVDKDGKVAITKENVSQKAAGNNTVVYSSKSINLDSNVKAKDVKKHKEFIDSYMTISESLTVEYDDNLNTNPAAKIKSMKYEIIDPLEQNRAMTFTFEQVKGEDCTTLKGVGSATMSGKKLNHEAKKEPKFGTYDRAKCAEFSEYLEKNSDLLACMNSVEKLVSLKRELHSAKGLNFDEKKEKKALESFQKNILKTFDIIEDSMTFKRGCDYFYSKEDYALELNLKRYNEMQSSEAKSKAK